MAYINHLGGTVSLQLVQLAKAGNMVLSAHISGVTNQVADVESRRSSGLEAVLEDVLSMHVMWDPFTSHLSFQLNWFFSWIC